MRDGQHALDSEDVGAAALKQLGAKPGKADKTKSAIFELLRQLNKALPGPDGLLSGERTPGLMAAMAASLQDKNQQLKLDAAITLRQAIETHPTAGPTFQPHMAALTPLVVALCSEEWYKLIAEGLRLVGACVRAPRTLVVSRDRAHARRRAQA